MKRKIFTDHPQSIELNTGVDPVIVLFARVTLAGGRRQWIRSVQRAIHTHDVQSILLAGPKLISGGKIRDSNTVPIDEIHLMIYYI